MRDQVEIGKAELVKNHLVEVNRVHEFRIKIVKTGANIRYHLVLKLSTLYAQAMEN